jgi:hypothetical protein
MSNRPLPTGEAALELALAHLFVSMPMRLDRPHTTEYGMPPLYAAVAGVSIDQHGWLYAWIAYVPSVAVAPRLSVWPTTQTATPFDSVLPATAELALIARVDTAERAVARLSHALRVQVQARLDPDLEYLHRAVAAYRADLRAQRDRADAWAARQDPERTSGQ